MKHKSEFQHFFLRANKQLRKVPWPLFFALMALSSLVAGVCGYYVGTSQDTLRRTRPPVRGGSLISPSPAVDGLVACTMEAKLCPDGSAVGRSGPKCEFAACPIDKSGWKSYELNGILEFQYLSHLSVLANPDGAIFVRNQETYRGPGPEQLIIDASFTGIRSSYEMAVASARETSTSGVKVTQNSTSYAWAIDLDHQGDGLCTVTISKYGEAAIEATYCEPKNRESTFAEIVSTLKTIK